MQDEHRLEERESRIPAPLEGKPGGSALNGNSKGRLFYFDLISLSPI